jgi:Fe-S oxidoreductase
MTRADLTEKILDIKREKGWTWKYICDAVGGMSPVIITGALLGQMKLTKSQAGKAGELFGLTKAEAALLNEVPHRGGSMPPTDPLIYRFYELVMVNGPAWKALIEEEFGDGIMSAIDFDMQIDRLRIRAATGSRSPCPASSCLTNTTALPATCRSMVTRKNERAPAGRSDALERSARFRHSPGSLACACSANGETSMAGPRVGLFVTCLIDLIRPSVGFAAVKLLEGAGCVVDVPRQACCGQPAFNSGDRADTRAIAEQVIAAFESFDYIVVPSGSCAGMLKVHYPELFRGDPNWQPRADAFAAKCFELISFLVDVMGVTASGAQFAGTVTYHDSCSGLRELGVKAQPRTLLATVAGLTLSEMPDADVCCGFGGTFCVKYPEISNAIVAKKVANIRATGAGTLLAGDLGCLMNMAGKLSRDGSRIDVRHVAEVLAGMTDEPAIAAAPREQRASAP